MLIGGAELYREALPQTDRFYLTHVHTKVAGDAHFQLPDNVAWHSRTHIAKTKSSSGIEFEAVQLDRK